MTILDFNRAVDDYSDGLYRFIVKSIKDQYFAQDIVQDSYEKLWRNRENVNGKKVKSYLFTTAYHTMIDRLRKEKRMVATDVLPIIPETRGGQYSDLTERLNEAVERLPETQKTVIILRDYEGYSYQEIGEICSLTEAQVKVYIYRARLFLKKYIGNIEVLI